MARVPFVDIETADPVAQATLRHLASDRGDVPNIYRSLAHSPQLLQQFVTFIETLWKDTSIPRTLQELVILRVAQQTNSNYEWGRHRMLARRIGVPEDQVTALSSWRSSGAFSDAERTALDYTDAIVAGHEVPEPIFSSVTRWFDEQEIVELTMTASLYVGVARYLASLQIELEPGFEVLPRS